jgi:hypothetical protein
MPVIAAPCAPALTALSVRFSGLHRVPEPLTTEVATGPESAVMIGPRRVRLHNQTSGLPVRDVWSEPGTGVARLRGIVAGTYYAVAFDQTGAYNGAVVTDIVAESMRPDLG